MSTYGKQIYEHNLLAIGEGDVTDHIPVLKFGYNPQITNGSTESVWLYGGLYPWSAFDGGAVTLYLKSTSASDTETLVVEGLDSNYDQIQETVTLTGTTAVATTLTYRRVSRMRISGPEINVGDITAHAGSAVGTVVSDIGVGYGQTLKGTYTIPNGYYGMMMDLSVRTGRGDDVLLEAYKREPGEAFRIFHLTEIYENMYRHDYVLPKVFPPKTDVDIRATAQTQNVSCSVNFDLILVHESGY